MQFDSDRRPSSRGRRPASVAAAAAAVEPLARRVLMSVSLSPGGILKIIGSDNADAISLAADPTFVNVLDATLNGRTTYVSLGEIQRIDVRAKGGDDVVRVDASLDELAFRAVVDAGDGDDRVVTGAGNDTVAGGAGDDSMYGNGGNDSLVGDAGRDRIDAGPGNDTLSGGAGNDSLVGDGGNDHIDSGKGNDRVNAGDGDDVLSDKSGRDTVNAGDGDDRGTFKDAGVISAGAGFDTITSGGAALLNGEGDDDKLTGRIVNGGKGNDTITGTGAADALHGNVGNDVIYGRGGDDELFGDDGRDVLYGGAGDDRIHGGDGDDNLYGDDGATLHLNRAAAARYDAGHDVGLGEGGSDWFEPTHDWAHIDGNDLDAERNKPQNPIKNDPSLGQYGSSYYGGPTGAVSTFPNINIDVPGAPGGSGTTFAPGTAAPFKELGHSAWLSTGTYDAAQQKIVPGAITADNIADIGRSIVALPAAWTVGEMTTQTGGDVVWYRVSLDVKVKVTQPTATVKVPNGSPMLRYVPIADGATVTVKTMVDLSVASRASIKISPTTAGLFDGVEKGAYRFIGVRSGTILVSETGVIGGTALSEPKSFSWQSHAVPLPGSGEVRVAGDGAIYHLQGLYTARPTGVPEGERAILVAEGAVLLPDTGATTFVAD